MSDKNTLSADSSGPLGEISQAPPALEVFLDKHQSKIIALAILLAIAAVSYVVYQGIDKSKEDSAGVLLSKAEDLSEFQEVVKNHEGTAAADSAKLLLAEKQWEDGQQDDAIATLKAFVEGEAGHPARPSAQASLGAKLLTQGKTDEAAEIFKEITGDAEARHLAPYALICLGDISLAKGDKDEAAEAYETVEREYPESPFAQEAMQRRTLMKASAPVEVEAAIVVPDANLTGEEGAPAAEEPKSGDLIDAFQGGGIDPGSNPLIPSGENPE